MSEPDDERPWTNTAPGQLVSEGHGAGDVIDAWKWKILEQVPGVLEIEAPLPEKLKNPQGQLFGGFTPAYVDFISLYTVHTLDPSHDPTSPRSWLTTINMRCDYMEPITGPLFRVRGELVNQRGKTFLVSAKFFQGDTMAAHALTTLRTLPQLKSDGS